jgi:DNA polymerase-1
MGIDTNELTEAEFQTWRGLGKGVNFAKNYGVGVKGASEQFGLSLDVAKALCEGYNIAFPTVITYQNNVSKAMGRKGFVSGIYGRRYYLTDSWRFYKAANYLIQGSCAHDLKLKMVKLDKLLEPYKSCMITCIHDEIIYRIHHSEEWLIPQIKAIMEYTPKIQVPIVSEVDYTETNWANKHKYELKESTIC